MSGPSSPNSWQYRGLNSVNPGLDHLSNGLIDLVKAGRNVVAGSADLQYSNGLNRFARAYPDRYISFGISEQNMVSVAAGMAACGLYPSLPRLRHFSPCWLRADLDGRGVRRSAGPSDRSPHRHFARILRHVASRDGRYRDHALDRGSCRRVPFDGSQLEAAIRASADYDGPIYFRIGRGRDPVVYDGGTTFTFGKAHQHIEGEELTIIACGMTVHAALAAARSMNAAGRSVGVIDMASIKPLDREAILSAAGRTAKMMTVEEHNVLGGLGAAVAEVLTDEGCGVKLKRHGIYDEFSLIAPPHHLYAHYKLDAAGIEDVALAFLAS